MKKFSITIFLILILAAHGLGNAEQAMEQARGIADAMEPDVITPPLPVINISHQLTALQYSAEAGGMGASSSREAIRNIVCGAREPGMRLIALAAFLILLTAALCHSVLFAHLPGVFTLPAGRVAVTYIHLKDGRK